jgi:hypothetical protein
MKKWEYAQRMGLTEEAVDGWDDDCPKTGDTYTMTFFYTVAVEAADAEDAETKGWGVFKTNLDAGAITVGDFVASDPEQVEM